ncbi:MAG: P-loop NTPase [Dehalococcoidia bacterium]|nr:P-loop NTPase [Dehalococcoidia bacterium]
MGLFHCPLGAAYYEDDACIDCGLCIARTAEARVEASRKIREYMKSHSAPTMSVSKIAVCGKGGSGKTTAVTLLTLALKEAGYQPVVVDADESNPGLGRMLGVNGEPKAMAELFAGQEGETTVGLLTARDQFTMDDIPAEYVAGTDGIRFMAVGKITDPFQGCGCGLAGSARQVVEKLVMKKGEVLVVDMEAGVESFGRGVERHADTILIIVEPSFESIVVAERISQMAQGMGIGRVGAILNKISSEALAVRTKQELDKRGIKVFGIINYSPELAETAFEGKRVDGKVLMGEIKAVISKVLN